ncbi:MAG: FtsW/RodA/SpoVE family cell cycle protein [Anaerolineaceae bacterium]|nr:FtsW/RodA/SpoVE family cell cycle protein [Anaerolineaceae bacterium]
MISPTTPKVQKKPVKGLTIDIPFILALVCLLVMGLMMVYSTDLDASLRMGQEPGYLFQRQVLWVALGLAVMIFLAFFDYHNFVKLVIPIAMLVLAGLVIVLVRNEVQFNSSRALFSGSVQPGELAKMAVILYLSVWLSRRGSDELSDLKLGLLPLLMVLVMVAILIFFQPDISAAVTILALGIMMFYLGGGSWRHILMLGGIGLSAGLLAVRFYTTGRARVADYLKGLEDPTLGSYHIRRSFEALIKGRFFGVGLGNANTKFTGLPLPHTDSIFAVIAEEIGLFGSFIVMGLYILLIWRAYKIAQKAPDQLGSLMAFGLTSWIVIEALLNIAVIVGLFPFAGNTLPFISAGGSSMVTNLAAVGIIINIARQGAGFKIQERSQTSATVDLRRRDWRRSVSGADRYRRAG